MSEWQPIATAPKDGTMFLAWAETCPVVLFIAPDVPKPCQAPKRSIWSFWRKSEPEAGEPEPDNSLFYWMPIGRNGRMAPRGFGDITHWTPLPDEQP